jgi:DNA polymerase III epsilon subunit-like protein
MSGLIFYTVDLETNGLRWANNFHEICEFSILRAHDRVQLTRMVRVIHPENSNMDALNITKKSLNDLKTGISPSQLVEEAEEFLSEDNLTSAHRCIIGHNVINFDRYFLWNLWGRHKRIFPAENWLDTIHLFKAAAKKHQIIKPKFNLQAACDLFGVEKVGGQHNAKADTQNCFLLWQKLTNEVDFLDHIRRLPHNINDE